MRVENPRSSSQRPESRQVRRTVRKEEEREEERTVTKKEREGRKQEKSLYTAYLRTDILEDSLGFSRHIELSIPMSLLLRLLDLRDDLRYHPTQKQEREVKTSPPPSSVRKTHVVHSTVCTPARRNGISVPSLSLTRGRRTTRRTSKDLSQRKSSRYADTRTYLPHTNTSQVHVHTPYSSSYVQIQTEGTGVSALSLS